MPACLKTPVYMFTVSQHLYVVIQAHLFARLQYAAFPLGITGIQARHALAVSQSCHMATQACLLLCLPCEHLFVSLLYSSTATWCRGLTCSYLCLSQHCHVAAHACLVCMPTTSQGYYSEAPAHLYAHLIVTHLTMRQPRLVHM